MRNIQEIDLTGQTFGQLTALRQVDDPRPGIWWECQCACGNRTVCRRNELMSGRVKSCGCLRRAPKKKPIKDLTGQRFGMLTVLRLSPQYVSGEGLWECRCDCGQIRPFRTSRLTGGHVRSCGQHRKVLLEQRFGKLTVREYVRDPASQEDTWRCECDCGNWITATTRELTSGAATSCGRGNTTAQSGDNDLNGQRFGMLTAQEKSTDDTGRTWYKCKCDCGNTKMARAIDLLAGRTKSCGCTKFPKKDLTGARFGQLTVIERDMSRRHEVYWKCVCDCGNERTVLDARLKSGRIQDCGDRKRHPSIAKTKTIDLTGQQFGRLTVLGVSEKRLSGELSWDCLCDCGNSIAVRGSSLRSGRTRSCGCLKSNREATLDLTGQRFGKLTVLRRSPENVNNHSAWVCKCDCGRETVVQGTLLRNGHTRSCGCLRQKKAPDDSKNRK